jgi:hypothetical protein
MLTIKPERSFVRIGRLPICRANSSAVATVSSAVSSATTTSTSRMTGTGEKKCSPSTRSGWRVAAASPAIGIDDVFEARIALPSRRSSRAPKTPTFCISSSTIASITSCVPSSCPRSEVQLMRSTSSAAAAGSSLPPRTPRCTEASIRSREACSGSGAGSKRCTTTPARAADSAMPDPMNPAPTTPISLISPMTRA